MGTTDLLTLLGLVALATANVGLWTFRVALASAGRRGLAAGVAGVEAVLFAVAFGTVVSSLDEPVRVAAYALGVGVGTYLGIVADERLAGGQSLLRIVVDGDGEDARSALHARGWPATSTPADGVRGPVSIVETTVDDRCLTRAIDDVEQHVPEGFVTVERLRRVDPIDLGPSMHNPGRRRLRGE